MTTSPNSMPIAGSATLPRLVHAMRSRIGSCLVSLGGRIAGTGRAETAGTDAPSSSGDRFANLASMIPGVVYQRVVHPDGTIRYTYISEGARDVFGVSPAEVLADPEALFKTYSDEYKTKFRERLIEASRTLTTWDVEASIKGPDGELRFTHAIAKPERMADGAVLWTGLILDATRIKQVEDELKAAYRTVEAATKAKSLFLANMSHEIRTPMNGVLGMADLLLKTELQPRQHRLLSTLKNSAQTLLGIINDVLDISRIEAGRFNLESESFDLRQCVEEAIDLCAGAAYQKGLELNLIVAGALPPLVRGDSTRLRQVLINLIGNAVKFTEKGDATIRVSCTAGDSDTVDVRIDVIDTGIGIDPEARERLFAPFTQADSSISRRFGGTGLGLAITRHLVDLMGGTVELESAVGTGTRVSVLLPLEVDDAHEEQQAPGLGAECRVLVVDDRQRVREAMASLLQGTGAMIDQAASADEARSMLLLAAELGTPYTFAVVDRLRPGAESVEFARLLGNEPQLDALRIITVVSMNWKGDAGPRSEPRRGAIIAKPLRRNDLLSTLLALDCAEQDQPGVGPAHESEPASAESDGSLGMHVLLAEDNPVNQEVAREYLGGFGCTVVVVQNGEEAIDALAREPFDIVLMDCQMPVLDGLSAAQRIRAREAAEGLQRTTIVAVTANAYDSDRVAALEAGMDDYLVKPFSDEDLLSMLQRWKPARASAPGAVRAA